MQANIKLFSSYTKANNSTRYIAVLEDNTIWWYMPGKPWQASPMEGLPANIEITQIVGYAKGNDTRYVVLLADNTIWWYRPNAPWQLSPMEGLPENSKIKHLNVYLKQGYQTRYVVVLEDNTIWWYMPNSPWQSSPIEGLPTQATLHQADEMIADIDTMPMEIPNNETMPNSLSQENIEP